MKTYEQFLSETPVILRESTTLRKPYVDWGFLTALPNSSQQTRDAWTDDMGKKQNAKDLADMKKAYDARRKYPDIKVIHPVDPSSPSAGWDNDEDINGLTDEQRKREDEKYEKLAGLMTGGVDPRSNAISGMNTDSQNHEQLASELGYRSINDALKKGLVQYTISAGGTPVYFATVNDPKSRATIVRYLQANKAVKGLVLISFLNKENEFERVEFNSHKEATDALNGKPIADRPTITVKGQEFHVLGQQTDKQHPDWVHYVLQDKNGKMVGLSKSKDGRESNFIPLSENFMLESSQSLTDYDKIFKKFKWTPKPSFGEFRESPTYSSPDARGEITLDIFQSQVWQWYHLKGEARKKRKTGENTFAKGDSWESLQRHLRTPSSALPVGLNFWKLGKGPKAVKELVAQNQMPIAKHSRTAPETFDTTWSNGGLG